jgi:DNA-binding XRE family transcriptional regulator
MEQNKKSMDVAPVPDSPDDEAPSSNRPRKRAAGRAVASNPGGANRVTPSSKSKHGKRTNRVRETRIERMMSKAELARRAGVSVLTIDRVEKGLGCRMDTKRKILEALGLNLADRVRVFGEEE